MRTLAEYREFQQEQTRAGWRRARARKAGIASGAARRKRSTCKAAPRPRSGQQALALRYKIRQVGVEEFEQRYRAMCEAQGIPFDRRGMNTTLELYRVQLTAYRAQGQDYETTNAQAARALELRDRPRCRRTIQRIRKRLEAMGLIAYEHVRRSGHLRIPGQMDTLRVRCLCPARANVTPPTGARAASALRALDAAALASTAQTALIPPPTAADGVGPLRGPGTEEEQDRSRLRWLQLKLEFAPTLLTSRERQELAGFALATELVN